MALSFFLNCIILILGSQRIFALAASDMGSIADNIALLIPCKQVKRPEGNISSVVLQDKVYGCNVGENGLTKLLGYHSTPGIGSHKFHNIPLPWNFARKICILEGGHLAVINSMAEAEVLLNLFRHADPINVTKHKDLAFLGIHDMFAEGDWVTLFDEDIHKAGYSKWSNRWGGQPNNMGLFGQNCGALVKDDALEDIECLMPLAFICEIPQIGNVAYYNDTYEELDSPEFPSLNLG